MAVTSSTNVPNDATALDASAPRARIIVPDADPVRAIEADRPVTVLGSRRDCDLCIEHSEVSKVHCAIVNTGRSILVADLCSRTGVFVDGKRVSAAPLEPGKELRLGSVVLTVEWLGGGDYDATAGTSLDPPLSLRLGDQTHELASFPAVIGRRKSCTIQLDTPDVSLAHTLVFSLLGAPMVFDLGSRSGTILNGDHVSLAPLRGGDELLIGGESLRVIWQGADDEQHPREERSHTDGASLPDAVQAFFGCGAADLDALVEGVQNAMGVIQTELAKRMDKLSDDRAELAQREEALEADRLLLEEHARDLEQRESQFGVRQAELAERERELQQRDSELRAAESDLQKRRDRSRIAVRRLRALRDETLQREREADDALRDAQRLAAQAAERKQSLADEEKRLERRRAELNQLESRLEQLKADLDRREQELRERESREAEAVEKIARFKSALAEASQVFASVDGSKEPPDPKKADPDADAATSASGSQTWPAPVVDRPLFGGADGDDNDSWPKEWTERLALLRRVSDKCDDELRAQVRAEFESLQAKPKRGAKKRWWS
ncbi:MAG: FHA domain-containing protein [Planctomycetota bacterium]|nr:MAG: FHA domain-containing protein [Planctomycetota bacterium]